MSELKPCPFCGNEKIYICTDDETEEFFGVMCTVCGGSIYPDKETEEEAIEAWNRRANEPETDREIEELYEAINHVYETMRGIKND